MLDPDLDKIVNPHEVKNFLVVMIICFSFFSSKCGLLQKVKHWMDPQLIPYGWGLFKEEEEVRKDSSNVMKEANLNIKLE